MVTPTPEMLAVVEELTNRDRLDLKLDSAVAIVVKFRNHVEAGCSPRITAELLHGLAVRSGMEPEYWGEPFGDSDPDVSEWVLSLRDEEE